MVLYIKKIIICYLVITLVLFQSAAVLSSLSCRLFAQEQNYCMQRLAAAEELYYSGAFDEAIDLAKVCIKEKSLSNEQRAKIFTLLAKAFMAKGDTDAAGKLVSRIFEFNPDYHPTIEQETPRYVRLVDETRAQLPKPEPPTGSSKWWWIGGSAIAVGALAVIIFSGGNDSNDGPPVLPAPPDYPDN